MFCAFINYFLVFFVYFAISQYDFVIFHQFIAIYFGVFFILINTFVHFYIIRNIFYKFSPYFVSSYDLTFQ